MPAVALCKGIQNDPDTTPWDLESRALGSGLFWILNPAGTLHACPLGRDLEYEI